MPSLSSLGSLPWIRYSCGKWDIETVALWRRAIARVIISRNLALNHQVPFVKQRPRPPAAPLPTVLGTTGHRPGPLVVTLGSARSAAEACARLRGRGAWMTCTAERGRWPRARAEATVNSLRGRWLTAGRLLESPHHARNRGTALPLVTPETATGQCPRTQNQAPIQLRRIKHTSPSRFGS